MTGIDRLPPLREVIAAHGLAAKKSLGQKRESDEWGPNESEKDKGENALLETEDLELLEPQLESDDDISLEDGERRQSSTPPTISIFLQGCTGSSKLFIFFAVAPLAAPSSRACADQTAVSVCE